MTELELLAEVKKGIDFHLDGTWDIKDLYGHFMQVIKEEVKVHEIHKTRFEKFIFRVMEMRATQRSVRGKHLSDLPTCKNQEKDLDNMAENLLTMGYNIDRYRPNTNHNNSMFNT